jgi:hypothetical protein
MKKIVISTGPNYGLIVISAVESPPYLPLSVLRTPIHHL